VPTENLSAYDAVLRGREAFARVQRGANVEAQALFERAIALDPDYADAYVELGWALLADFKFGWTQWPRRAVERAGAAADLAIALDSLNASAHSLRADVRKFLGDGAGAERAIERALDLNPNNAMAHGINASLMLFEGRPDAAVTSAETAFRLDPNPRGEWVMSLLAGYYLQERFEDVVETAARYDSVVRDDGTHTAIVAMAHGMLGNEPAAAEAADQTRRLSPFFNGRQLATLTTATPEQEQLMLDGLEKAGLL
jgi:adenylate cyclase